MHVNSFEIFLYVKVFAQTFSQLLFSLSSSLLFFLFLLFTTSKSRSKRGWRHETRSFHSKSASIFVYVARANAWAYHLEIGKVERAVELWGWRSNNRTIEWISVFNASSTFFHRSFAVPPRPAFSLKTGVVRYAARASRLVPRTHLCTPCRVRK